MFRVLRALAPAVLLLASLSSQVTQGIVAAHLATDHGVGERHEAHHTADHHAEDHHSGADGEYVDSDHEPQHTHQLVPAAATAPVRIACPSNDVQPCIAVVGLSRFERPGPSALHRLVRPVSGADPPESQRQPILLI